MPPAVDPEAWGVVPSFVDASKQVRRAPAETVDAVLSTMRATPDGPPPGPRLQPAPRRAVQPARAWGWAAQLYAARSESSWGIGDLADLGRLARWAASKGAGFVLINPLHAATPVLPQEASPYYPSSRRFRNVLYLRVEHVPGVGQVDVPRGLNSRRLIDRDEVFRLKLDVLERAFAAFEGDARFDAYVGEQGSSLDEWASFCAIAEMHGGDFREWPAEYRKPDARGVASLARERHERVRFHQWLQWLLDEQLREASSYGPMMQDLAVGFAPGGADAWAWQDLLAPGMTIGAPPDEFNTQGQVWGLPPFDPWKLRSCGYRPIVETIRAGVRYAGGLRIDHALGLARLYWVPDGASPVDGVYVRYPFDDLLDVIVRESVAAGAYIVAEDLGTSDPEVLEGLAERGLLSYRLVWFEDDSPEGFPEQAMAAVTTHDLPTIAGLWTGRDLEAQRDAGVEPNSEGWKEVRDRLAGVAGVPPAAPVDDVILGVHRALAGAPSLFVSGTLDDALAVEERPNMPGTMDEWPNWCLALPVPLEELERHPLANAVADAMREQRPG